MPEISTVGMTKKAPPEGTSGDKFAACPNQRTYSRKQDQLLLRSGCVGCCIAATCITGISGIVRIAATVTGVAGVTCIVSRISGITGIASVASIPGVTRIRFTVVRSIDIVIRAGQFFPAMNDNVLFNVRVDIRPGRRPKDPLNSRRKRASQPGSTPDTRRHAAFYIRTLYSRRA